MEYSVLNKKQKDRMKAISNQEYVMEWEDPEFMDYLLGELPKVRKYQKDKEMEQEISSLEKALTTYDVFLSEKSTFLIEIAKRISDIHKIKDSWYGLSLYEIETYMKLAFQGADTKDERLRILEQKRVSLLDTIHFQEKKLNHLDYLRYEIKCFRK